MDKKEHLVNVSAGTDAITFDVEMNVEKDNPNFSIAMKPNAMGLLPWYGAASATSGTYDATQNIYTANLTRNIKLMITEIPEGKTLQAAYRIPNLSDIKGSITTEDGTPTSAQLVGVKDDLGKSYEIQGLEPGTYYLHLSSDNKNIADTYDLSGVYKIVFSKNGLLQMDHVGKADGSLWYAGGLSDNQAQSNDDNIKAGTKTRFLLGISHKPSYKKLVRAVKDNA